MITVGPAERVGAALGHGTRFHAFVVHAGLSQWTVTVASTANRSTVLLRMASETFVADADGSMHLHVAAAVEAAGVERARIDAFPVVTGLVVRALGVLSAFWNWFFDCCNDALDLSVPGESSWTRADRLMVHRLTERIDAARTDTRISALLTEASFVSRTIGVDHAFWIDAHRDAILDSAFAVVGARRRITRVGFNFRITFFEWIAN